MYARVNTVGRIQGQLASSLGAFLGLACLCAWADSQPERMFLIGSFGATCVLVYGCPNSPLAQPRNVIGGHVLSALVGTLVALLPLPAWAGSSLAVALAIFVMERTNTVHPPGGATALIATLGSVKVTTLGLWFAVFPVGVGAALLVAVAVVSNRALGRAYPLPLAAAPGASGLGGESLVRKWMLGRAARSAELRNTRV